MHHKNSLLTLLFLCILLHTYAQIKVAPNGRFLQQADGQPFFWLGDTDWELFHRLNRDEAREFIKLRAEQGFNVIQAVALAEENGLRSPNRHGDYPLNNEDPTQLSITPGNNPTSDYEYDYWDHVDYIIKLAADHGMYIGLLPTWGDKVAHMWGQGPIIFNEQNAETYGRILATRYKDTNIIWILGGDRPAVYKWKIEDVEKSFDDRLIWRSMAKGIEGVLGPDAFITYHPSGGKIRTTDYIHNEPWLDMNAFQSGHGSRESDPWNWVTADLLFKPAKPTLDMEPCYEDHPVNPWDGKWTRARGYFSAYDVRARVYRSVFAGGSGVTYGHHEIWQFLNAELYKPVNIGDTLIPWQKAAHAEAAYQMQHLKNLMLSRPYFERIADQTLIVSEKGSDYSNLLYATRDAKGTYAFIYLPQNKPVSIDLSKLTGTNKNVWWYDVRTGKSIAYKSAQGKGKVKFTPPVHGTDWVLVLDDASKKFDEPGKVK